MTNPGVVTMTIGMAGFAARIANGIADGFIDSSLQRRYDASAYARKFLQQQIAKTRAGLEKSERELVAYAQAEGIINTSTGEKGQPAGDASSLQGESLIALNKALADATARRVQAEGAYRNAQLAGVADATQATQALRESRASLEADYQDKRTLMKPDHPDMLSLRSRIEELDRQIASAGAQAGGGRASTLLADYRAALSAEGALQGRVASLKGSVLDLRGRSVRYNILQREVDTNRGLYDALLQRYKEIGVAGGVGASPVSIVDRATVPSGPYKPNLLYNLLGGLGLGLLAGIAAALALEFLHDTIKTREDVRTKLGLACLGIIPRRRGKGSVVEDLKDTASAVSEAYSAVLASLRSLRTSLVVFDTAVVDLTDELSDPVEVLFGTQLGGGTDINRAIGYSQQLITRPRDSIFVLISDLYEGGVREQMLRRVAEMTAAGVQVVVLLALSDEGAPAYDHENAAALAALGVPAFACTPDAFPEVMAAAIERRDLMAFAQRVADR